MIIIFNNDQYDFTHLISADTSVGLKKEMNNSILIFFFNDPRKLEFMKRFNCDTRHNKIHQQKDRFCHNLGKVDIYFNTAFFFGPNGNIDAYWETALLGRIMKSTVVYCWNDTL